tara:strand:+ start:569 stop:1072 length:504 start_codon:yes stop_codon:yes gene_type:complete
MDVAVVQWEGVDHITATTSAENQDSRLIQATYVQLVSNSSISTEGSVVYSGVGPFIRQMRYLQSVQVPLGKVPRIFDEGLCFDPRTRKIIATYEALVIGERPVELGISWSVDLFWSSDLNQDGIVDGSDLGSLMSSWGSAGGPADLNTDGIVDGNDLGILLMQFDNS